MSKTGLIRVLHIIRVLYIILMFVIPIITWKMDNFAPNAYWYNLYIIEILLVVVVIIISAIIVTEKYLQSD